MIARMTLLALVAGAVSSCSRGPGGDASREALEQQRTDVLGAAGSAVDAVVSALGGSARAPSGKFEGCVSSGLGSYGSFQYAVRGRVDVGPDAARPYVGALADVLVAAGFRDVETRDQSLTGQRDGVEVVVSEFAEVGDYVLVDASGPCVETPGEDTAYWTGRAADTAYG